MANITLPAGLISKVGVEAQGYRSQYPQGWKETPFEAGAPRRDAKPVGEEETVSWPVWIEADDKDILDTWYRVTLKFGTKPFEWVHPFGGGAKLFEFTKPLGHGLQSSKYLIYTWNLRILGDA